MVEVLAIHIPGEEIEYLDDDLTFKQIQFKDIVLMQFTGLKDKNGEEIYEGDIVVYNNLKHEVYWNKDYYRYEIKEVDNPEYFGNFLAKMGTKFEVVGNIYEKPKLLENK